MSGENESRREHPAGEIVLPDHDSTTAHQPLQQRPDPAEEHPVREIVLPVWHDGSMPTRRDQE